jgi:hypothetical protein
MGEIDKRGVLDDEIFSYQAVKDGRVFIFWHEKHVTTLRGKDAQKFLTRIAGLEGKDAQLLMAKVTGNFKRGNERSSER